MERRKIIVLVVLILIVVSIISGYIFERLLLGSFSHVLFQSPSKDTYTELKTTTQLTSRAILIVEKDMEKQDQISEKHLTIYSAEGRFISYTAELNIIVPRERINEAVDKILSVLDSYNGYIVSLNIERGSAHITVKVPQENLFIFISKVSNVGEISDKFITGVDVTDKIIDLKARIKNAEVVEAHLLELLKKAGTITEMLEVMRELSRIREEIEVMKAQLKNLEISTSYASISIKIYEKLLEKEYVEIKFKVLDSRNIPVPETHIYVKSSSISMYTTDVFGEAVIFSEKGLNITLIAVFQRSDGEVLKTSMTDISNQNKTILVRFDKPSEPQPINLDMISKATSILGNYLIIGFIIITVVMLPIAIMAVVLLTTIRKIYTKLKSRKTI